jgi:hypothetical protein
VSIIQDGPARAGLIARIKNILLSPKTEWEVIEAEAATTQGLYVGYIMILAAIPAIMGLLVSLVVASMLSGLGGMFGVGIGISPVFAVISAVITYALSLVMVYVFALVIDALAPTFGGVKSPIQALKVSAYTATSVWVASLSMIVPPLGFLVLIAAAVYACYLCYLGLKQVMKAPEDKAVGYTIVAILITCIIGFVVNFVVRIPLGIIGGTAVMANHRALTLNVPGQGSINLGKLEEASKQIEANARAAEAAAAAGQPAPAAVGVVAGDKLQALLPDNLPGGFARKDIESNSGGLGGMQISTAKASYDKGDGRINLSVIDMGAMGALAGAVNVNSSKTTANGYEKMGVVNGHMTTEEYDRSGKSGKYSVMAGGHFMIEAEGTNVSIDDLKAAVNAVGVGRVEALAKG